MTLRDRIEECSQLLTGIGFVRPVLTWATDSWTVAGQVSDLQSCAARWTGQVVTIPEGSPSDVRASADEYSAAVAELEALEADLRAESAKLAQGMSGDAARAAIEQVTAFADLARLESAGLRVVADALRDYARSLARAQSVHGSAAEALQEASGEAHRLDAPRPTAMQHDLDECARVSRRVDEIYDDADAAIRSCQGAFQRALDAETVLRLALGDAAGYARLAGLRPSASVSRIDAVLALAAGVGDPDKAIVSADEWEAYLAARKSLGTGEQDRLDAALRAARTPEERQAVIAALATGAGLALTLALATRLGSMTSDEVSAVASLGVGDVAPGRADEDIRLPDGTGVRQMTGTTCGSATLLMLAAQRDPFLALFLATGEFVDGHVPEYLADIPLVDRIPDAGLNSAERIEYVQTQIRIQTNRSTFWPGSAVGSAPWGYGDEVSRVLGRDADMNYSLLGPAGDARELVEKAVTVVDAGTPVPFLVGPSGTDVPRHYVLLVGHDDGTLQFYEPGSGDVRSVPLETAVAGESGAIGAFGNWEAIYGAAVPVG